MKIESVYHLKQVVSSGKFAGGGYPKFYVTADGGVLSHEAVKDCWPEVADAVDNPRQDPQWEVKAYDVNYENLELYCDHTGDRIPAAYEPDDPWQELRDQGLVSGRKSVRT